jgi:hypothetical protein
MGKERDITAFFGAPRAASKAVKADQAVEETDTSTKRSVVRVMGLRFMPLGCALP